jgi:hypothetical protein
MSLSQQLASLENSEHDALHPRLVRLFSRQTSRKTAQANAHLIWSDVAGYDREDSGHGCHSRHLFTTTSEAPTAYMQRKTEAITTSPSA